MIHETLPNLNLRRGDASRVRYRAMRTGLRGEMAAEDVDVAEARVRELGVGEAARYSTAK